MGKKEKKIGYYTVIMVTERAELLTTIGKLKSLKKSRHQCDIDNNNLTTTNDGGGSDDAQMML